MAYALLTGDDRQNLSTNIYEPSPGTKSSTEPTDLSQS